jgi:antitoxin ParD1/3/4
MARRIPLTISLTPQLDEYIAEEVSTGRYGTSSEVVRAALRLLQSARKREVRGRSPASVSEKGGHRAIR